MIFKAAKRFHILHAVILGCSGNPQHSSKFKGKVSGSRGRQGVPGGGEGSRGRRGFQGKVRGSRGRRGVPGEGEGFQVKARGSRGK